MTLFDSEPCAPQDEVVLENSMTAKQGRKSRNNMMR
jgi:hypothetical protein